MQFISAGGAAVPPTPSNLEIRNIVSGFTILSSVIAREFIGGIDEAEFRATFIDTTTRIPATVDLRLASEGGSFVPNGTTRLQITSIDADDFGAFYKWTSANPGRWFVAWRLHNSDGWSCWSDGNTDPEDVVDYIDTEIDSTEDTGAPSGWSVTLSRGPVANTVMVQVTRPTTNGRIIRGIMVQVVNGATVTYRELDTNAGQAATYYDGSAIAHGLSASGKRVTRAAGAGFGTAQVGDLACLDVTGGAFAIANCQNRRIVSFEGGNAATATYFDVDEQFEPQVVADLRVRIVKPPWLWDSTDGYLGDQANRGFEYNFFPGVYRLKGDRDTDLFTFGPIEIPAAVTQPEARVWIENGYSASDDALTHSTGGYVSSSITLKSPLVYTPTDLMNPDLFAFYPNAWYGVQYDRVEAATGILFRGQSGAPGAGIQTDFPWVGYVNRGVLFPDPVTGQITIKATWDSYVKGNDAGASGNYNGFGIAIIPLFMDSNISLTAGFPNNAVTFVRSQRAVGLGAPVVIDTLSAAAGDPTGIATTQISIGNFNANAVYGMIQTNYTSTVPVVNVTGSTGAELAPAAPIAGFRFIVGANHGFSTALARIRLLSVEIVTGRVDATATVAAQAPASGNNNRSNIQIFKIWLK